MNGGPSPQYLQDMAAAWGAPDAGTGGVQQPSVVDMGEVEDFGQRQPVSFQRDAPPPPQAPTIELDEPQAPPAAAPAGMREAPEPDVDPTQVEYLPVGGGTVPAHEQYMRGPQQHEHAMASFEPNAAAAGRINDRTQEQVIDERLHFQEQADRAIDRQQVAEATLARRQQEMQARFADYQSQIARLGEMKLDNNRLWNKSTTGDKIGAGIALFLGGLFGGPQNKVYDALIKSIDDDVESQKFDYQVAQDRAKASQTAFGMMMDRYGTEDAASAAARAAALDYAMAKTGQISAQWKGVDSANAADKLTADLAAEKERTIANGFKFIPAQAAGQRYKMAFRGHVAPGTFTEAQAQANFLKHQTEPYQADDRELTKVEAGTAGHIATERAKMQNELAQTGGLGKAGAEKLALEERQATQERDANLNAIREAEKNIGSIVEGGPLGAAAAKTLPAGTPFVTGAIKNANTREAYNRRVMLSIAAAYKLSTDATEPKNIALIEHFAAPYEIHTTDNEEVAGQKMRNLKKLLTDSAAAKGSKPPANKMPPSAVRHGKK